MRLLNAAKKKPLCFMRDHVYDVAIRLTLS
jgi:hypothetical protein